MRKRSALSSVAVIVGIWTIVACLLASSDYCLARVFGSTSNFDRMLRVRGVDTYSWALLSLFIWWSVQRFPLLHGKVIKHLPIHLWFALMGSTLQITLLVLLADPYSIQQRSTEAKFYFFIADTTSNLIWYAAWVAITSAFIYYRTIRDRELDSEKLQARLVAAQLKALKMQLNPHFLFNTLNSISSLMRADVELADSTMEKLAVLLRIVLNKRDQQFVSLREEVELLEVYLEIEQVRFGPRLQVRFQVQPEALDASIPDMILQPLLENAIVHGISRPNLSNHVRVRASLEGDWVVITIENDSDVRPSSGASEWKMGSGLESVVLRLQKLYPGNHKFETRVLENGLARVMLQIPFSIADVGAIEEVVYAN